MHSGLSLFGLCVNKHTDLCRKITSAEIIKSYLGVQCTAKSDYDAVENMREVEDPPWRNDYFKAALGIRNVPSAARLRQRFDEQASDFESLISKCLVEPIRDIGAPITPLDTGHV